MLGSVLDITLKSAFLGLETESNGGLSIYGFSVDIYIESVNMSVFKLSEVSVSVAYNKNTAPGSGSEVSLVSSTRVCSLKPAMTQILLNLQAECL